MRTLLLLIALLCVHASVIYRKQLAGPPSEFSLYQIPSPSAGAVSEKTSAIAVQLTEASENTVTFQRTVYVDSTTDFSITWIPYTEDFQFQLQNSEGKQIPFTTEKTSFIRGSDSVPCLTFLFSELPTGPYLFTATSKALNESEIDAYLSSKQSAIVLVYNESPTKVTSHLTSYSLTTGNIVGLEAKATNDLLGLVALNDTVKNAKMYVFLPNGEEVSVPMQDDGLALDRVGKDGVYTAAIHLEIPGRYLFSADVEGVRNGVTFRRTTEHLIDVIDDQLSLTGNVRTELSSTQLNFFLGVKETTVSQEHYRAYAEVWGRGPLGLPVPIAWVAALSVPQSSPSGTLEFPLSLDLNWIARARAKGPFTLRNVVLQDPDYFIPLATASSISVPLSSEMHLKVTNVTENILRVKSFIEITREMREGPKPAHLRLANVSAVKSAQVMVHGYCAKLNPWALSPTIWDNPLYFEDFEQNRLNDDFAQKIIAFAAGQSAFSLIAHSQGGLASLHLRNYYHTGLDNVSGGRKIQSLSSPYLGTGSSGWASAVGSIIGTGCGTNNDLTPNGAALWLSGISEDSRADLYYYTTQGSPSYCNLLMNTILKSPNDGVVEISRTVLSGGNSLGNSLGECHIQNMKYPAGFLNTDRNTEMNANTAKTVIAFY